MSPDKESNSPQGSTNSHETEDYTQDNASRGMKFSLVIILNTSNYLLIKF